MDTRYGSSGCERLTTSEEGCGLMLTLNLVAYLVCVPAPPLPRVLHAYSRVPAVPVLVVSDVKYRTKLCSSLEVNRKG